MAQFNTAECARTEQCSVEAEPVVRTESTFDTSCLDHRVEELVNTIKPEERSEERRTLIYHYVRSLVQRCFQPCQVVAFMFGSVPLKTYLPDGDIDLSLFQVKGDANIKPSWTIKLQKALEDEERNQQAIFAVRDVQVINAEVNLVKCLVDNTVVDISFETVGGHCTVLFLETIDRRIGSDHLFKRSIILVKAWCYYESRLLGAHHGLISTYALEVLVLYIFNFYHKSLTTPLQVLRKFLDVFSTFDWDKYCLSLQGPVPLESFPNPQVEFPEKLPYAPLLGADYVAKLFELYSVESNGTVTSHRGFQLKFLNIIDPLLHTNNLGRSVSKASFSRVRKAFAHGAKVLTQIFVQHDEAKALAAIDHFFRNTWKAQRSRSVPRYSQPPPPSIRSSWSSARSNVAVQPAAPAAARDVNDLHQVVFMSQKAGIPNQFPQYHNPDQQSLVTCELMRLLATQYHANQSSTGTFRATLSNPELRSNVAFPNGSPLAHELERALRQHRSSMSQKQSTGVPRNGSLHDFTALRSRPAESRTQTSPGTAETEAPVVQSYATANGGMETVEPSGKTDLEENASIPVARVAVPLSAQEDVALEETGSAGPLDREPSSSVASSPHQNGQQTTKLKEIVDSPLAESSETHVSYVGEVDGTQERKSTSETNGDLGLSSHQGTALAVDAPSSSASLLQTHTTTRTEEAFGHSPKHIVAPGAMSGLSEERFMKRSNSSVSVDHPENIRLQQSLSESHARTVSTGFFQPSLSKQYSRSASAPTAATSTPNAVVQAWKDLDAVAAAASFPRALALYQPLVNTAMLGSSSTALAPGARGYNTAAGVPPLFTLQGLSWTNSTRPMPPAAAMQLLQQEAASCGPTRLPAVDLLSGDLGNLTQHLQQARVCSNKPPLTAANLKAIAEVTSAQLDPSGTPGVAMPSSPQMAHMTGPGLFAPGAGEATPLSAAIAAINHLHQMQGSGMDPRALQRVLAESQGGAPSQRHYDASARHPVNGPQRSGGGPRGPTRRSPDMFHGRGRHRNSFHGPADAQARPVHHAAQFVRPQKASGGYHRERDAQRSSPDLRWHDSRLHGPGSNHESGVHQRGQDARSMAGDRHRTQSREQITFGSMSQSAPTSPLALDDSGTASSASSTFLPSERPASQAGGSRDVVNLFPEERPMEKLPGGASDAEREPMLSSGGSSIVAADLSGPALTDKFSNDTEAAAKADFVLADEDFPALGKIADSKARRVPKIGKSGKEKASPVIGDPSKETDETEDR